MNKIGQLIFVISFLFVLAGCNQNGMHLGGGSFSGGSSDSGASSFLTMSGSGSGDGSGDLLGLSGDGSGDSGSGDGSGIQVARVHNPEPTSMALLGIGLLGLARRFRRK